MKKIPVSIVLALLLFLLAVPWAAAQEEESQKKDIEQLKKQVLALQRQMQQMREDHRKEIESLKERIARERPPAPEEEEAVSEEDEAEMLRKLAEGLVGEESEKERAKPPEETVFRQKGLSLQRLNPEISVTGDILYSYTKQKDTRRKSEFDLRSLEFNFQSYLDPFSRFQAVVPIDGDGNVEIEEAYFTRFSIFEGANLTIGRFRQQFGVINRWHGHSLDQVNYPLPIQLIFGDDGLSQTGLSLDVPLPGWGSAAQELTAQITNSDNEHLFSGDALGIPSFLLHYKNFRDLSRDTYLEFGLSGLFGWNDKWSVDSGGTQVTEYNTLPTMVFGADFTIVWEPADRSMYSNLEWRSELFALRRDILAPDDSGRDRLQAWGAFSYLQSKLSRTVDIGFRADYYKPDSKDYADSYPEYIEPFAYSENGAYTWQITPYITWWQSEFVRFRAEYNYRNGRGMENASHALMLQLTFSAGPHKHERY